MQLETLEGRRFLSVTVSEGYPGFYEIHGDDGDDVIDVSVSQSDESFAIDGTTYTGVSYIFVHGYGGDDAISVVSADGAGSIGASISAGHGSDTVVLNFDGAVWAGKGDDILYLSDSFRGEAYGDVGNDQIYISGACVDPVVSGGEGDDLIDCSGNYCGVVIEGDSGNDTIYGSAYDDQIDGGSGSDSLFGGSGNDIFYDHCGSGDAAFGGDGTDILYADGSEESVYEVEYIFY